MATTIKWGPPVQEYIAYLGAELNALANDKIKVGGVINNSTNRCLYLDLELVLSSLDLSGESNPTVDIYLIESIDGGSNFDTVTDAATAEAAMPPVDKICAKMGLRLGTGAEAKLATKTVIPIAPGHWKLCPRNKTGVALGATGNVLSYRTNSLQGV